MLEEPDSVDRILQDWQSVLAETLQKWNIKQQDLQVFFEDFRNNLLQHEEVNRSYIVLLMLDANCIHILKSSLH